jgi:hypothetical protein
MSIRVGCLLLLFASSCCSFAQLEIRAFNGLNFGCDQTVLPPNSTLNGLALPLGTTGSLGPCLTNAGKTAITVTAINVTGTDFSLEAGNQLPLVIQPTQPGQQPVLIGINFAPTTTGTKSGQITLIDDATGSPQTFFLSGEGFTDFGLNTFLTGSNSFTVTAGQTASYTMSVTGVTNFFGAVNLGCSNLPSGASCTFSPAFVVLGNPSEFVNFGLNVATTAPQAASLHAPNLKIWYGLAGAFVLALVASGKRRKKVALLACLLVMGLAISCGGGTKSVPTPTPAGTFSFLVNATSNGVTHSKTMVLVVK